MTFLRLFFLLGTLLLGLSVDDAFANEAIAIVVHKSNPMDKISSGELSRIYRGVSERWDDGRRIVALNRPTTSNIRILLYQRLLNAPPTKKFFRPGSPIPFKTTTLRSGKSILRFVSKTENAIGYVYMSEVTDTVKVLRFDERLPNESRYKLQPGAE